MTSLCRCSTEIVHVIIFIFELVSEAILWWIQSECILFDLERNVKDCSGRFILCDAVPFGVCPISFFEIVCFRRFRFLFAFCSPNVLSLILLV